MLIVALPCVKVLAINHVYFISFHSVQSIILIQYIIMVLHLNPATATVCQVQVISSNSNNIIIRRRRNHTSKLLLEESMEWLSKL